LQNRFESLGESKALFAKLQQFVPIGTHANSNLSSTRQRDTGIVVRRSQSATLIVIVVGVVIVVDEIARQIKKQFGITVVQIADTHDVLCARRCRGASVGNGTRSALVRCSVRGVARNRIAHSCTSRGTCARATKNSRCETSTPGRFSKGIVEREEKKRKKKKKKKKMSDAESSTTVVSRQHQHLVDLSQLTAHPDSPLSRGAARAAVHDAVDELTPPETS
jgi:hypothetical protein